LQEAIPEHGSDYQSEDQPGKRYVSTSKPSLSYFNHHSGSDSPASRELYIEADRFNQAVYNEISKPPSA